jgi:glycine/serine hydroxymethyltransferase
VIKNARALADELVKNGYKLQTGGTDSHLVLWDLRPLKLTGSKVEKIGDLVGITINSTFLCAPFPPTYSDVSSRKRRFGRLVRASAWWHPDWHRRSHIT